MFHSRHRMTLRISSTFTDWKKPHTETRDYSLIHGTLHPFSAEDHRIVMTGKSSCNLSVFVCLSANLGLPDETKLIKYIPIMAICLYLSQLHGMQIASMWRHIYGRTGSAVSIVHKF
jgi:hypothetical protein